MTQLSSMKPMTGRAQSGLLKKPSTESNSQVSASASAILPQRTLRTTQRAADAVRTRASSPLSSLFQDR
eukprot:1510539-Pleurochrysis_carterae.AAC.1